MTTNRLAFLAFVGGIFDLSFAQIAKTTETEWKTTINYNCDKKKGKLKPSLRLLLLYE